MAQRTPPAGYTHGDPWDVNWLRVDPIHELYYQQYGKKDGKPGIYMLTPPVLVQNTMAECGCSCFEQQ